MNWEVYGVGQVSSGTGAVWEDYRGFTNASFDLGSDGTVLRLRLLNQAQNVVIALF